MLIYKQWESFQLLLPELLSLPLLKHDYTAPLDQAAAPRLPEWTLTEGRRAGGSFAFPVASGRMLTIAAGLCCSRGESASAKFHVHRGILKLSALFADIEPHPGQLTMALWWQRHKR